MVSKTLWKSLLKGDVVEVTLKLTVDNDSYSGQKYFVDENGEELDLERRYVKAMKFLSKAVHIADDIGDDTQELVLVRDKKLTIGCQEMTAAGTKSLMKWLERKKVGSRFKLKSFEYILSLTKEDASEARPCLVVEHAHPGQYSDSPYLELKFSEWRPLFIKVQRALE